MKLIFLIILNLAATSLLASKVTAVASGNWNNDATWDDTHPGCYDSICIPAGITVTLTSNENLEGCSDMLIFVDGVLALQTGKKLRLPCGDTGIIIEDTGSITVGGGGGGSTFVEICGDQVWNAGMGDIAGPFILSIELLYFKAELINELVEISWQTSSERNNSKFIVEHSTNFWDWNTIETVKGAGNSSINLSYESIHKSPQFGVNYYRLTQVDFDGNKEVFPPITIINDKFKDKLHLFPNPSEKKERTILIKGETEPSVVIRVFSVAGELILHEEVELFNKQYATVSLPNNTNPGVYFVEINGFVSQLILN